MNVFMYFCSFCRNAFKETLCGKRQETTTFGTLANGGNARSTAATAYDNSHLQVRNGNGSSSRPPSRLLATPTNTAAIQLNGSHCNLLNVSNLRCPRKGSSTSADIERIRLVRLAFQSSVRLSFLKPEVNRKLLRKLSESILFTFQTTSGLLPV